MIEAVASQAFPAIVEEAPTGLVGTIGVTIRRQDGTVETARSTAAITEFVSGSYVKTLTAPATPGNYIVVWDTGGATPTYASENLEVGPVPEHARVATDEIVVMDRNGNVQPNTPCWIYERDTTNPATLYDSPGGAGTVTQPITTDDDGYPVSPITGEELWVEIGSYDVTAIGFERVLHWEAGSASFAGLTGGAGGDLKGSYPSPLFSDARDAEIAGKLDEDDNGYLWKRHGVVMGSGAAAQDANIEALLTAIGTQGGETRPQPGITRVDSVVVPHNRAIRIRGYGPGWRSTGGHNTALMRKNLTAEGDAMFACDGVDFTNSGRALLDLYELMLDGARDAGLVQAAGVGPLLRIQRASESHIEDVRLYNNDGYGAVFGQFDNGHIEKFRVSHCGKDALDSLGRVMAAVAFYGMNDGGTVRVHGHDWQFEQNYATDLVVGNKDSSDGYATEFNVHGLSFEGGLDAAGAVNPIDFPYIEFGFCEISNFSDITIFSHRSVPNIVVDHGAAGFGEDDGVHLNGLNITQSPTVDDPDYMIEVKSGSLHIRNATLRGAPNIAYIHVESDVHEDAFSFDGNALTRDGSAAPPLIKDDRGVIS